MWEHPQQKRITCNGILGSYRSFSRDVTQAAADDNIRSGSQTGPAPHTDTRARVVDLQNAVVLWSYRVQELTEQVL